MDLLYSNILPLGTSENQKTTIDCFSEYIAISESLQIAVGYVSCASLEELERLVDEYGIKYICVIIGMYYFDGMPENSYHTAMRINDKWQNNNIGEIRIVKTFKYHGKAYCFYGADNEPFSAIIGSANLGFIKPEAANRRQYEFSAAINEKSNGGADIFLDS